MKADLAEPLMDFQCYVGKYEIKRLDELPDPDKFMRDFEPANMPYLVQVGSAALRRPKLDYLKAAVGHLLQTPTSKWTAADEKRRRARYEDGEKNPPFDIDADELSAI